MKKIIFLNGPPGCGKDTIANILTKKYNGINLKFAQPLRSAVCALFDIKDEELDGIKNEPLNGTYRIRDLMIDISEKLIKPNINKNWYGYRLLQTINNYYSDYSLIVISDLGFVEELIPLDTALKNIWDFEIWQIYRENYNFINDSRNYIMYNNIPIKYVINNNPIDLLENELIID